MCPLYEKDRTIGKEITLIELGGMMVVVVGPLLGALWGLVNYRFKRIECDIRELIKTSLSPETCKSHTEAIEVKIEGVDKRVDRLEVLVNNRS